MRADRLISILMLLQSRGRMTARQLAEALEVSERTIYRDVEALSASGVPLYAEHGPGGGLALLDSYRTNLTGLDEYELRALFMMFSAPGPLDKLGATQELKSAVLKLSASLSEGRRAEEERVRQRFLLDWSWWFHDQDSAPHLSTIQRAVWEDRCLRLRYQTITLRPVDVTVNPYGLVAKAGVWYLVARLGGALRVYPVSSILEADLLEERYARAAGFDLAAFWRDYCADYERNQQRFWVTLRVSAQAKPYLPLYLGRSATDMDLRAGLPDADGWQVLEVAFENLETARSRILSLGSAVEVLEPIALRLSVMDVAAQVVNFYAGRTRDSA